MSDRLYLYLTDNPTTPLCWHSLNESDSGDWARFEQWLTAHPQARARPCLVLLAASLATRLLVSIPGTQRDKAVQALPFALEELAIDDADSLRLALGARPVAPGRWPVLLMNAEQAREIEQALQALNLRIEAMISMAAVLAPPEPDRWLAYTLPHTRSICVLTSGDESFGFSPMSDEAPEAALSTLAAASTPAPAGVDWATPLDMADWHQPAQARFGNHLPSLVTAADDGAALWRRRWRQVAVAALAVLALDLSATALHTWQANRQIQTLNQQITTDFHAALPTVTRLVNARVQLQQALDARQGAQTMGFLPLLADFSEAFSPIRTRDASLRLTALRFDQGALTVDLTADHYASLNTLQQTLGKQANLRLSTRDAGVVGGTAKMQIKLTPTTE